jgi:hypothetical protein
MCHLIYSRNPIYYMLNSICVTVGIHYRSRLVVELLQVPHVSWGRMPSTTVQWSKSKLTGQARADVPNANDCMQMSKGEQLNN